MKFIVDGMLGGLARWLRILGHAVLYDPASNDTELLNRATSKETILLTRDKELYNRAVSKNLPALLVLGESEDERLAQISRSYAIPLTIDMEKTLCPECGTRLKESSKEEASGLVPSASLRLYERFWKCENSNCGKFYWKGSHWQQINRTLTRARNLTRLGL